MASETREVSGQQGVSVGVRVTAPTQPKTSMRRARSLSWLKWGLWGMVGVVALLGYGWWSGSGGEASGKELLFHTVQRSDLSITVVERGNLESQNNIPILCEVDDVRRDGINGTPIVWVIPNGSKVKKGDLLVELDSAPIQERRDLQTLEMEQAREASILARSRYENQKTQNATKQAQAELDVALAELELKMFADEKSGTHKLEVEEIKRRIDDLNNDILAAKANLKLRQNDREGIEKLFRLGYAGKSELDRSQLEFLQAESSYAAKINRLRTELATLTKKETYERRMQEMRLEGKLETAKRNLDQVMRNNEALLAQAKASLEAKEKLLTKSQELLTLYESQYEKCKIYSPQDGMVAYAEVRGDAIRPGTAIRTRQTIMTIPDMTRMQVRMSIHESVLEKVRSGLKATIRVDARSDKTYAGTVETVAVLPEQTGWRNADTKVYETIVTVDEAVENLKPGMTAVVEIHVAHLEDVVTVPVQAVVQRGKETWVYVATEDGVERREVDLGATDERVVEVKSGLAAGERVVLTPHDIDKRDRDGRSGERRPSEPVASAVPEV